MRFIYHVENGLKQQERCQTMAPFQSNSYWHWSALVWEICTENLLHINNTNDKVGFLFLVCNEDAEGVPLCAWVLCVDLRGSIVQALPRKKEVY